MKYDIVQHYRWIHNGDFNYYLGMSNSSANPRGGVTVAGIIDHDGSKIRWGISKCHIMDNFNKKRGRVAIGLSQKKGAIVTENFDFSIARPFADLLATVPMNMVNEINFDKYIEILKANPEHKFHTVNSILIELYLK